MRRSGHEVIDPIGLGDLKAALRMGQGTLAIPEDGVHATALPLTDRPLGRGSHASPMPQACLRTRDHRLVVLGDAILAVEVAPRAMEEIHRGLALGDHVDAAGVAGEDARAQRGVEGGDHTGRLARLHAHRGGEVEVVEEGAQGCRVRVDGDDGDEPGRAGRQ